MKRYDVFAVYDKASWVAGERINLNGTPYPVAYDYDEEAYYLNTGSDDIPSSLLAVYPSDTDAEGNDVTNSQGQENWHESTYFGNSW